MKRRAQHFPPIRVRVERRLISTVPSFAAPADGDALASAPAQQFMQPAERGPQPAHDFSPPVGHIVDPATVATAKALVGAAIFIAGVAVGKIL